MNLYVDTIVLYTAQSFFSIAGAVCKQGAYLCEWAAVSLIDNILIEVAISGDRNAIKKGLDKIL